MNLPLQTINYTWLGTTVYDMLRQALISGKFRPNDRLKIRDIAQQVGTSVTPVRDAILQLAKEQALEMRTPKDIRVPQLDTQQYDEIRNLRLELEGYGAERAAELVTPDGLKAIEHNIYNNMQVIHDGDLPEALRLNSEFHLLLAECAQMPLLTNFINSLWMRAGPLVAEAYAYFSHRMAIEHHQEILDALSSRNGRKARLAIQEDILDGNQKMIAFLNSKR